MKNLKITHLTLKYFKHSTKTKEKKYDKNHYIVCYFYEKYNNFKKLTNII